MEMQAYNFADSRPPSSGEVYVVNMPATYVRKFEFSKEWMEEGCDPRFGVREVPCTSMIFLNEIPVESQIDTYVDYVQAFNQNTVTLPRDPILGVDVSQYPSDGYDLVQNTNMQDLVGRYIKESGIGFVQDFMSMLAIINPFQSFDPSNAVMTVRVITPDGSTHLFFYDHARKTFVIDPKLSRDPNNNRIPLRREDVAGGEGSTTTYDFTGHNETLIDFIDRMNRLGVPITGPAGNVNESRFECSSKWEGERLVIECRRT